MNVLMFAPVCCVSLLLLAPLPLPTPHYLGILSSVMEEGGQGQGEGQVQDDPLICSIENNQTKVL